MNVLDFVKPLREVIFVYEDDSVSSAVETIRKHRFASIPILNRSGNFVGTLTEGDLLRFIFEYGEGSINIYNVYGIERYRDYVAVSTKATIQELIGRASDENFVPIVDDQDKFIGIVTRKTLLNYFFEHNFIIL